MDVGDSMRSSFIYEHPPFQGPIQVHYNPPDGEFNVWMYAMIGVGSAFIVFVIASIYLMCKSPAGNEPAPLRRHPTKTTGHRTLLTIPSPNNPKEHL